MPDIWEVMRHVTAANDYTSCPSLKACGLPLSPPAGFEGSLSNCHYRAHTIRLVCRSGAMPQTWEGREHTHELRVGMGFTSMTSAPRT